MSKTSRNGPRNTEFNLAQKIDSWIPMEFSIEAPRSLTSEHPEIVDPHLIMGEMIGQWLKNVSTLMARGPPPIYDGLVRHKLCHVIARAMQLAIPTYTRAHVPTGAAMFQKHRKKTHVSFCQPWNAKTLQITCRNGRARRIYLPIPTEGWIDFHAPLRRGLRSSMDIILYDMIQTPII